MRPLFLLTILLAAGLLAGCEAAPSQEWKTKPNERGPGVELNEDGEK